ncbi:serine/threonine protein kinase [Sulfuricystis multivorans]|uniref:serine/threonine protein kinase n=1 Tax=Sulfuricystis multivorans TaxID=2211108 RepID=UPI000F830D56|nr:serine/threonine-protein kinase [Sulfuricystis multivorans]
MAIQQTSIPLPAGHVIDGYRFERQLSMGGFSIVYLATDPRGQPVAIKEYLPQSLARRTVGLVPQVKPEHRAAYHSGMMAFYEEGIALARLDHPNVVRVENFLRANDTVYLVMAYERGRTLHEHIRKHPGELSEKFVRGVFMRLLSGLREVHASRLLHLDIKPSNIWLRLDASPVLIDFGAARQTLQKAGDLRPVYTPGYAAPEQYDKGGEIGPWTDVYAVGASMYACLAAAAPTPADLRLGGDPLIPASQRWAGRYSPQLLDTIDQCLRLDPLARPQSAFSLQRLLAATPTPVKENA